MTGMLRRGDGVPHFVVRTVSGVEVSYTRLWQHTNLVLVALPHDAPSAPGDYGARVEAALAAGSGGDVACVVTRDPVRGLPPPAVLVADRWGEIVHVTASSSVDDLPAPDDLREWVDYTRRRCPECEGEAW